MPGQMSNYLENAVLKKLLGQGPVSFAPAANLRMALCTTFVEADDGATMTEVSSVNTGYARQAFSVGATTNGTVGNAALISFPKATTNWGTPQHWVLLDASVAGNALWWGPISNPLSVKVNEKIEFDPNQVTISFSGALTATGVNQVYESVLRGQAWTLNPVTHVGLLTTYTADQTFQEIGDTNYARQAVSFAAVANGASSNTARVQWPAAAANYQVNYIGLFNALAGGELVMVQSLASPVTVDAGKNFRFEIGDLQVTLD